MNEQTLNKKWDIHKVVTEAIQSAHIEPSPETRERLTSLEVNQQNFMDKLQEFQNDNKEAHNAIMTVVSKLDEKLDKALEKKANKWTETAWIWAFSVVGAASLTMVVRWVILLELK